MNNVIKIKIELIKVHYMLTYIRIFMKELIYLSIYILYLLLYILTYYFLSFIFHLFGVLGF